MKKKLIKIIICCSVIFLVFNIFYFINLDYRQNLHINYLDSLSYMVGIDDQLILMCKKEVNKNLKINTFQKQLEKKFPLLGKKYFLTKEYSNMTIKDFENYNFADKNFIKIYSKIILKDNVLENIFLYNYKKKYKYIGLIRFDVFRRRYKGFMSLEEVLNYNREHINNK